LHGDETKQYGQDDCFFKLIIILNGTNQGNELHKQQEPLESNGFFCLSVELSGTPIEHFYQFWRHLK